MKKGIVLGVAMVGGAIAFRFLLPRWRTRLTSAVRRRISERMEQLFANLPEGSPPKLIVSVLPKLQAQNDQIIAILREQNEILRDRQQARSSSETN